MARRGDGTCATDMRKQCGVWQDPTKTRFKPAYDGTKRVERCRVIILGVSRLVSLASAQLYFMPHEKREQHRQSSMPHAIPRLIGRRHSTMELVFGSSGVVEDASRGMNS